MNESRTSSERHGGSSHHFDPVYPNGETKPRDRSNPSLNKALRTSISNSTSTEKKSNWYLARDLAIQSLSTQSARLSSKQSTCGFHQLNPDQISAYFAFILCSFTRKHLKYFCRWMLTQSNCSISLLQFLKIDFVLSTGDFSPPLSPRRSIPEPSLPTKSISYAKSFDDRGIPHMPTEQQAAQVWTHCSNPRSFFHSGCHCSSTAVLAL